jgi:ABC-2 type transport system permease protein
MMEKSAFPRFEKYRVAGVTSAKNRLTYRGNFAGSVLTYGLFVFVFSRIWAAAYTGKASIAGYDFRMSVWYFIVAELSVFGFGHFFWSLADDMKSGQVAYLLTRPYSFVGYHFAQSMGQGILEAGILILEGGALGLILAGLPPLPALWRVPAFLVSLLLAGSLQFFLQMAIALTAFWVEENSAFFWIFQKLALVIGTLLPLEFLPAWAAKAALFTPLPSLSYAPARIVVAASPIEALGLIGGQAAWLVAAIILAQAFFSAGRSKVTIQGG